MRANVCFDLSVADRNRLRQLASDRNTPANTTICVIC
jgi:hypothetical protein